MHTARATKAASGWLLVLVTAAFVVWLIAKVLTAIGKPIMITVVVVVAIAVISILVMAVGESVTADKPVAATSKARRSSATALPVRPRAAAVAVSQRPTAPVVIVSTATLVRAKIDPGRIPCSHTA